MKVREAKRRAEVRWGSCMAKNFAKNKRMFRKERKQLRKKGSKMEQTVKDVTGQVLTDKNGVNRCWVRHFEELLNFEDDREARIMAATF